MSLEDVIEKFCSRELIAREQDENKNGLDNIERSYCSQRSQSKIESEDYNSDDKPA